MMLFGKQDVFGIEVHIDSKTGGALFGRMCIWMYGTFLGDIYSTHCSLYATYKNFKFLFSNMHTLWDSEFISLKDDELYKLLDAKYYGYHGDVEINDTRSKAQIEADAAKYGNYIFLTNWGEQFDGAGKCFVVSPSRDQLKVVLWNQGKRDVEAFVFQKEPIYQAIKDFISWYESSSKLSE